MKLTSISHFLCPVLHSAVSSRLGGSTFPLQFKQQTGSLLRNATKANQYLLSTVLPFTSVISPSVTLYTLYFPLRQLFRHQLPSTHCTSLYVSYFAISYPLHTQKFLPDGFLSFQLTHNSGRVTQICVFLTR